MVVVEDVHRLETPYGWPYQGCWSATLLYAHVNTGSIVPASVFMSKR